MSVPLLPRYYPPSTSLRSVAANLKATAQSKAEEAKRGKSDYSGALYITPNEVKRALETFLKENESSTRDILPPHLQSKPLIAMIQKGSFTIPSSLHVVCAIILFEQGNLQSTLITGSESKLIEWRNDATVTFLPGDSRIDSEGEGFKVFYFSYYQEVREEK